MDEAHPRMRGLTPTEEAAPMDTPLVAQVPAVTGQAGRRGTDR